MENYKEKNQIDQLLNDFSDLIKEYEEKNERVEKSFNIFSILDVTTDEVKICRVLQEFLSPKGSHNKGDLFLKEFIEIFLQLKDFDYKTAKVDKEYYTDAGRRIDLVIESCNYFIPIEVKINAGDQPTQCSDYYKFAKKYTKEAENCSCPFIVYLTIDGHKPSKKSKGKLEEDQIKTISFENDIKALLERKKINTKPIIKETINQFIKTIDTYKTKIVEEKMVEKIMESSENMKNANFIAQHLNEAKIKMRKKVFADIDKIIISLNKPNKTEKYKSSINDISSEFSKYYGSKPNTANVMLRYEYKTIDNPKNKIIFEISIKNDIYLYYGFVQENNGKKLKNQPYLKNLSNYLQINTQNYHDDSMDYIIYGYLYDEKECPDFRNNNDLYFKLFDEVFYEKFIKKCTEDIIKLLQK